MQEHATEALDSVPTRTRSSRAESRDAHGPACPAATLRALGADPCSARKGGGARALPLRAGSQPGPRSGCPLWTSTGSWVAARTTLLASDRPAASTPAARTRTDDQPAYGRDDGGVNRRPTEDLMDSVSLMDCAGRRRSPATLPSFHQGLATRACATHPTRQPWKR